MAHLPLDVTKLPATEVYERLMAIIKAKDATLQRIDRSMEFVYKVVEHERVKLKPAGLDGHLNAIGGTILEVRDWIKAAKPNE